MIECAHENKEPRKRGNAIYYQCPDCFDSVGTAVAKNKFTPEQIDAMPEFEVAARDEHQENEHHARMEELSQERQERSKEWWARYNAYLISPEWLSRRERVLWRDNYLCQSCLEERARQVHHKTYERLFNEPAFDLESVCIPCHEVLHKRPIAPI